MRDGSSTVAFDKIQDQRPHQFTQLIPTVSGQQLQIETAWARAALQCPAIHDLEYSPDRPLTFESFFSISFTVCPNDLADSAQPGAAYHQFCGPGTPPQVRAASGG